MIEPFKTTCKKKRLKPEDYTTFHWDGHLHALQSSVAECAVGAEVRGAGPLA